MTAFRATYSDWKVVKGRKVVQVVLELPLEAADQAYQVLGGMPMAANEIWCAVARLDERKVVPSVANDQSKSDTPPRLESNASAGADKPKKSPAQIAGYLCTLGSFQEFLRIKFTDQWVDNAQRANGGSKEEVAKETLYDICAVTSRTQLTKDNTEWLALQLAFRLWETEAEVVPA
jgi:hypothetical protein